MEVQSLHTTGMALLTSRRRWVKTLVNWNWLATKTGLAQQAERWGTNTEVVGSNPTLVEVFGLLPFTRKTSRNPSQ